MPRTRKLVLAAVLAGLVAAAAVVAPLQAVAAEVARPAPAVPPTGRISVLDTEVWSGIYSSAAIGTDGLGIISYQVTGPGNGHNDLRVAHCNDQECTAITTTDIDTVGDVGKRSSIKIGSDGLPLISYLGVRNAANAFVEDLKVAHCNDIACTSATVTTLDSAAKVNHLTSLTIGADGLGLISYQDNASGTGTKIKVAHCQNVACTSATLTTIDTVQPDGGDFDAYGQAAIATGGNGLGIIGYYDGGSNQMLKVAACTNPDCTTKVITVVDRTPNPLANPPSLHGGWASVTVGLDGFALISYHGNWRSNGTDLKVAHCSNVLCTASTRITADTGGYVGWRSSITIGSDGFGVISYRDELNDDLKVAHCTNLTCSAATTKTVDAFDDIGAHSSITIGTDGLPLISYLGQGPIGVVLRVLHCGNTDCTAPVVKPF